MGAVRAGRDVQLEPNPGVEAATLDVSAAK
jgi:hypothetical protein